MERGASPRGEVCPAADTQLTVRRKENSGSGIRLHRVPGSAAWTSPGLRFLGVHLVPEGLREPGWTQAGRGCQAGWALTLRCLQPLPGGALLSGRLHVSGGTPWEGQELAGLQRGGPFRAILLTVHPWDPQACRAQGRFPSNSACTQSTGVVGLRAPLLPDLR